MDQMVDQQFAVSIRKTNNTLVRNFNIFFSKIVKKLPKNAANGTKNKESQSNIHKTLNLDKSVEKKQNKKKLNLYSTLDRLSNDATHNPLR